MKVRVLQEDLSRAISVVSRFASAKIQLPVLANVLLSAKDNKLFLSATNLEISISFPIPAKIEEDGEITVLARSLADIILNLDKGQLELSSEKELLHLSGEAFESHITGMNATDFPSIPSKVSKKPLSMSASDVIAALSKVLFSVSSDETRPVLTGVLFVFEGKELTLVSTDGFRLSKYSINLSTEVPEPLKLIMPKNGLVELTRIAQEAEDILFDHHKDENQLVFSFLQVVLSSRVIDGMFPDFEKIIPQSSKIELTVGKDEFLRSVKLASVFAKDSGNVVKCKILPDGLMEVFAESGRLGRQNKTLSVKVTNANEIPAGGFVIAFNYKFIEDVLNVVKGESVTIGFTDANAPGVFRDPKDKNFLHIIMPVRL